MSTNPTRSGGRALPSGLTLVGIFAGLSLERSRRSKLLRLILAVLALPLVASAGALAAGKAGPEFFKQIVELYLRYLIPLVMALQASATVAEEVQAKTITYLFTRPVPRWTLPLGKYLGNIGLNLILLLPSLAVAYVLCMVGDGYVGSELGTLGKSLFAALLGAIYFGALAMAFGAMVTNLPFAMMLTYVLVMEVGFSFVPGWLKATAMTVHLRAIAGTYTPAAASFFASDPNLTTAVSAPVVFGVALLWIVIALAWVASTEYRTDR
ncbi:MAG: ABC transporter permease [Deltaproteobacteria bacterium]|nr:ABC transporter permease [Deltaproteobacteria bacterium]